TSERKRRKGFDVTEPHIHQDQHQDQHAHEAPPAEPGSSWTGYAVIKYGFILVITIVVLYFVARYLIPLFD
ncbi:MAG TPA: hypothetical protein VFZ45_03555, partial [Actinomycetota bacterium]|nr:hypothetical protein [Actinomycetota bacterium]